MHRSPRLLLLFSFTAVILLALMSWWVQYKIEAEIRSETEQSLRTVLATTRRAVYFWLREHQSAAKVWANTEEVRQATKYFLTTPRTKRVLAASPMQDKLRSWLSPINIGKGYQGYFIIGPDKVNLSSSRDQNIGDLNLISSQTRFFERVWSGKTAVSIPQISDVPLKDMEGDLREGMPTMFVGAPILDDTGNVIAIFTFRIDPTEVFTAILQQGRLGITGETYAFDGDGRLISESRFDDQLINIGLISPYQRSILNIEIRNPGVNLVQRERSEIRRSDQPLTRMATSAVSGGTGIDLDGYRDYRGVPVIGIWSWDPELGFGITTEMDTSEAYRTLHSVQYTITTLSVIAISLLIGLTIVFYASRKKITDSQQRLVERRTEAERRAEELEQFAYVTSHDLKAPLRAIRNLADWIAEDLQSKLDNQTRERLTLMSDRVSRMQALVEGLLDYCRVGRDKENQEKVDSRVLVADTIDLLSPPSGFLIDVARDMPTLFTNRLELGQVFANLIGNAIKHHGSNNGHISIGVRDTGRFFEFTIADDGPGIAPEYHQKIFLMFQVLSVKDDRSDTGIGLALVKKIVQEQGGSISLESREGEGANFRFTWPKDG